MPQPCFAWCTARESRTRVQRVAVGIVGGSDLIKIQEQMGADGVRKGFTVYHMSLLYPCTMSCKSLCTFASAAAAAMLVCHGSYARGHLCLLPHLMAFSVCNVSACAVMQMVDYTFSENGLVAHKGTSVLAVQNLKQHLGEDKLKSFLNFVLHYVADLDIPIKRGTFVEFRSGMLNISPIGRNCSQEERDAFEAFDKGATIRWGLLLLHLACCLCSVHACMHGIRSCRLVDCAILFSPSHCMGRERLRSD